MKKANVLFVYPNKETILRIPLSGAILCSALRKAGHNVRVFDSTFIGSEFKTDIVYSEKKGTVKKTNLNDYIGKLDSRPLHEIVMDILKDFTPDLIALTLLERNYSNAKNILSVLKKYCSAPVLAGGIMPTIAPDIVISMEHVDMICLGEGESAIVDVAEAVANDKDTSTIKNLWVKNSKGISKNYLRDLINMNKVPDQEWELFDDRHFYRAFRGKVYRNGTFELSRGCVKNCSFCVAPKLRNMQQNYGTYHRFKSPKRIIQEVMDKKDRFSLSLIHFGDTDFLNGMKKEFLKEFSGLYKKEVNLPFLIQSGGETLTEDNIRLLKEAGCVNISVGVESGSQRIRNKIIHKYVSKEKLVEGFSIARKYKLRVTANYMMGVPDETEEDIWETIKFNRDLNPPAIAAFFFTPFIGTELYDLSLNKGFIEGFNPMANMHKESPLKMPHLTQERINELLKVFVDDFKAYQKEY